MDEEEEDAEEEENDEEEEEDEEVLEFERGDTVMAQPPKTRSEKEYTVLTMNNSKQTATLKNGQRKYTNVPWDCITEVVED
jgi:hypothetical protein